MPFFVPFLYKTRVESGPKIETLISRTVFHINKIDTVKKAIALCERSYVDVVLVQVQSGGSNPLRTVYGFHCNSSILGSDPSLAVVIL